MINNSKYSRVLFKFAGLEVKLKLKFAGLDGLLGCPPANKI